MNDSAALLRWYVEQGVDEAIGEEPVDRFAAPTPPAATSAGATGASRSTASSPIVSSRP